MPSSNPGRVVGVLLLAAAMAACGSSTDNTPTLESLAALSGDAQHGNVGAPLPQPLKVKATGKGGVGVPGARISWTVTDGGGHLSTGSELTDPSGTAQVTWTLGPALGTQLVEARVGDLAPAVFTASAAPADPCRTPVPYTVGTSFDGALAAHDCFLPDGSYIDYYSFTIPSVGGRRFTLASDSFDTFLFIDTPTGVALALDNDGGDSTNASLQILLGPGTYQAGANSLNPASLGPYTLSSGTIPTAVDSCGNIWVTGGVKVSETIAVSDCLDPSGPYYSDELLIWLDIRQLLTVAEHSADFDALVGLLDLSTGKFVATDDDSGPDRDAFMSYTTTHAGEYLLVATTFLATKTGAYTLDVETPASDQAAAAPGGWTGRAGPGLLRLIRARETAALRRSAARHLPRNPTVK